jgi:hypothetical protein
MVQGPAGAPAAASPGASRCRALVLCRQVEHGAGVSQSSLQSEVAPARCAAACCCCSTAASMSEVGWMRGHAHA